MKCDGCDGQPVVTEVIVKNGQKIEQHLCEKCAAQAGITPQAHAPFGQLFTKLVISQAGGGASSDAAAQACPSCGLGYAEFRKTGSLGCPGCYEAFEPLIAPLIERAHEGATHHVGKVPRRAGASCDRQRQIQALRKELLQAVESEQFERAARLRDRVRVLEQDPAAPAADDGPAVRGAAPEQGTRD